MHAAAPYRLGTSKAAGNAVSLAEALAASDAQHVVHALDDWATQRRSAVEPLLLQKGPWLAQSFGLGNLHH
jgi:2-polyprenyl-6-methoxyphenol hydroxylase-like FAD-dependent oxidoreductase